MKTIRLATYSNNVEANLIKGRLENEGIHCFLTNENFSNLFPNMNPMTGGGTHLFVNELDYEKAITIISEIENQNMIGDKIICPKCKSENIKLGYGKNKLKYWLLIILSISVFTQFNNIKAAYICKDCKTEF